MKIGIIGTHGVGKSTLALQFAADFKKSFPCEQVGLLTGVARSCPFPINKNTSLEAQLWIYHSQMKAEIEMSAKNEIVVCDRTVLDGLAYSHAANLTKILDDCFYPALNWMETYDKIYWIESNGAPGVDGFRNTDPVFQEAIDIIIGAWIENYHIPVQKIEDAKLWN